jgi:cytoskeletal protein RodZ
MRLTLRTMLAFLDDILEPADAQAVGKKIEESEFATGLVHRMRDVTRRLRLGAPKLHGRGMGLDPNTVAEYLDNTLLSERVADFEKVCLESDVHLAEVASCHQILALVLGEPAEVESTSRQRLYDVIHQADAARDSQPAAKEERKSRDGAARKKKRRRPRVPEYLREPAEPEAKSRPWAAVLLVVLLLSAAAVGVAAYWPRIARQLQIAQREEEQPVEAAGPGDGTNGARDASDRNNNSRAGRKEDQPPSGDKQGDEAPSARATQDEATQTPENEKAVAPQKQKTQPVDREPGSPPDEQGKATGDEKVSEPAPDVDKTVKNANPGEADEQGAARPESTKKVAGGEEVSTAEGVGRLISEDEVLLRAVDDEWQRVAARGTVYSGQRLIALPTYRPSIAMSSGVTLQLVGGAVAALGKTDEEGVTEVQLSSGKLLLLTVAKPGAKVRLRAGDYSGTVEFGKEEAVLAVEVTQRLPDGTDPEQESAPASVDFYLTSGEATWADQRGRSETLRGRVRRSLDNSKRGQQAAEELPVWIEENELNPTERRARTELEPFLRPDRPVAKTLTDLATHRKIEISLLAAQSLALVEEFEPVVGLLNDPRYRINWTPQIDSLRAALARSPQTAAAVREAFERFHDVKEGDQLYRMLWGYTADQLEEGAAAQLIEWLDAPDDHLDFRVLSFWNLHHITGLGLYYQPGDPEKQRRTSIQRWKQKLESGLIVPKAT